MPTMPLVSARHGDGGRLGLDSDARLGRRDGGAAGRAPRRGRGASRPSPRSGVGGHGAAGPSDGAAPARVDAGAGAGADAASGQRRPSRKMPRPSRSAIAPGPCRAAGAGSAPQPLAAPPAAGRAHARVPRAAARGRRPAQPAPQAAAAIRRAGPGRCGGSVVSDAQPTIPIRALGDTVPGPDGGTAPARMFVLTTDLAGMEFSLDRASLVIGRTDENDIVLGHRSIPRHHAKIVRDGDHYTIVDLQSANGVRVNGEDYERIELNPGDIVELGHVKLRFVGPFESFVFKPASARAADSQAGRGAAVGLVVLAAVVIWMRSRRSAVEAPPPPPIGDRARARRRATAARARGGNAGAAAAAPAATPAAILAEARQAAGAEDWEKARAALDRLESATDPAIAATPSRFAAASTLSARARLCSRSSTRRRRASSTPMRWRATNRFPADSVYKRRAKPRYDEARTLLVSEHMAAADKARTAGQCAEVRTEVAEIIRLDPRNTIAREMVRLCRPPKAAAVPPPVAARLVVTGLGAALVKLSAGICSNRAIASAYFLADDASSNCANKARSGARCRRGGAARWRRADARMVTDWARRSRAARDLSRSSARRPAGPPRKSTRGWRRGAASAPAWPLLLGRRGSGGGLGDGRRGGAMAAPRRRSARITMRTAPSTTRPAATPAAAWEPHAGRRRLEHEGLERADEAQLDVSELDDVAGVQLDALVVLAVDANAVGALQIDDRVVVAVAHDLRVVREIDRWPRTLSFSSVRPITSDARSSEISMPARLVVSTNMRAGAVPAVRSGTIRRARESGWSAARRKPGTAATTWACAPGGRPPRRGPAGRAGPGVGAGRGVALRRRGRPSGCGAAPARRQRLRRRAATLRRHGRPPAGRAALRRDRRRRAPRRREDRHRRRGRILRADASAPERRRVHRRRSSAGHRRDAPRRARRRRLRAAIAATDARVGIATEPPTVPIGVGRPGCWASSVDPRSSRGGPRSPRSCARRAARCGSRRSGPRRPRAAGSASRSSRR